jgi:hypothetical protein
MIRKPPPYRERRPPPKRLPRRKTVTIALGIIGPFGVIIAADSEEGTLTAGDLKSSTVKITGEHHFVVAAKDKRLPEHKAILVSGAGDSGYLEAIKQHILEDFAEKAVKSIGDADRVIRRRIKTFYEDHVAPFAAFRELDLSIDLVIGASLAGGQRLWKTYMNTVKTVPNFELAAVGSGESWVKNIIPVAATMDGTLASATAAYAVFFAKEHATGCGKQTRIAFTRGGLNRVANQAAVDRLEFAFRRYSDCEKYMRNTVLGIPFGHAFNGMDARLNELRQEVASAAAELYPDPTLSASQTSTDQQ